LWYRLAAMIEIVKQLLINVVIAKDGTSCGKSRLRYTGRLRAPLQ